MFAGGWDAAAPGHRSATPPPPLAARPGQRSQPRWGDGSFISADTEEFIFVV